MARQIMAISEANHLIWDEIAENKWQETLISRFNNDPTAYEWCVISTTHSLKEEDVTAFVAQLEQQGFTIYRRWNQ